MVRQWRYSRSGRSPARGGSTPARTSSRRRPAWPRSPCSWGRGIVAVLIGAVSGGWAGGRISGRVPAAAVLAVAITGGLGLTVFYAHRYWRFVP